MKKGVYQVILVGITLFIVGFISGALFFSGKGSGIDSSESLSKSGLVSTQVEAASLPLAETPSGYHSLESGAYASKVDELTKLSLSERAVSIPALFLEWAKSDPIGSLQSANLLGESREQMIEMIFDYWAQVNPLEAAEYYSTNQNIYFTRNGLDTEKQTSPSASIALGLAEIDINHSLDWIQQIGSIADRHTALEKIVAFQAKDSPESALNLMKKFNAAEREVSIRAIAETWAKTNFDRAFEWIDGLTTDEKAMALPIAIKGLAESAPDKAINHFDKLKEHRGEVIETIVKGLAQKDPRESANWLAESTSLDEMNTYFKPLMEQWIGQDYGDAAEWLNNQEFGPARDAGLLAYIQTTRNGIVDPKDLAGFAHDGIEDSQTREIALTLAMLAWAREDEQAATQFAENADISADALGDYYHQVKAQYELD